MTLSFKCVLAVFNTYYANLNNQKKKIKCKASKQNLHNMQCYKNKKKTIKNVKLYFSKFLFYSIFYFIVYVYRNIFHIFLCKLYTFLKTFSV